MLFRSNDTATTEIYTTRHTLSLHDALPLSALAGLYAFFSLAGFPGTPGAALWLEAARHAVQSGRVLVIVALGAGWLAAIGVAAREAREAFGVASERPLPPRIVPRSARGAMWVAALGVIASALR